MRKINSSPRRPRAAARWALLIPALALPALAFASPEGGGEAGGANALTEFNPGLLIWTVITFGLLVALLRWKAWPQIAAALQRREDAVREAIAQARRDREEAEKLLAQHRALVTEARKETAALIEQGRRDAEKVRAEILERARREQQEFLDQGRRQIEHETRSAISGLQARVVDLALAASEKLMRRSLDGEAHRRLVEETLRELPGPDGGTTSS